MYLISHYLTFFAFWINERNVPTKLGLKIGMHEQAKSLSRETFRVKTAPFSSQAKPGWVSITLMVARRDSYQDFHKEGLQ